MLMDGKRLLITGVLSEASIATAVACHAIDQGAEVILTSPNSAMKQTSRVAKRLLGSPDILEFDVTDPSHPTRITEELASRWHQVDGALHSVGFAPSGCFGGTVMRASWNDVAAAIHASAYSLRVLADAVGPLMSNGGSIVGLTVDGRQAFPYYDWMGVAKATLEATSRYLARDLGPQGIRVNLVSAGPMRTVAARAVPKLLSTLSGIWAERAPLGWNPTDFDPVARSCVALLSDWFPATTGEIVHVDGGFHAVAAASDMSLSDALPAEAMANGDPPRSTAVRPADLVTMCRPG